MALHKLKLSICLLAFVVCSTVTINAQAKSPSGKVQVSSNDLEVTVNYSRPYKKGRKIFGGLVPFETYWRTGANLATEITFSKDVLFNGKLVKKGRYRLYSIPSKKTWTIALNSELGKKGFYEPNYDLDVLRTKVKSKSTKKETEQFTIDLSTRGKKISLTLNWDTTKVIVPIREK